VNTRDVRRHTKNLGEDIMKIFGLDVSVITIALITAYIGYQFSFRAKKKESFIKELLNSYNEVYFPMNELLQEIAVTEDKNVKNGLIECFMNRYSGPQSQIRFIGSSLILEYFYDLRITFNSFQLDPSIANEQELLKKIKELTVMIENEYWDAHDIIYEEHLQFRDDTFKNPILVLVQNLVRFIYYLSTFCVWLSLGYLYFAIWNKIVHIESFPAWWTIKDALILVFYSLMLFGVVFSIKYNAIKKNRRTNKVIKKLKKKLVSWFRR
jgi:hypothetical protein